MVDGLVLEQATQDGHLCAQHVPFRTGSEYFLGVGLDLLKRGRQISARHRGGKFSRLLALLLVDLPRAQDRVLCLDAMYVNAMLLILTFGIRTGSALYFEAALVIAVIGFVSTVALAKFLMRGEVIE